jgi:hypothetical protein
MNDTLAPDQIADLAGISRICEELGADLVVIGATSLLTGDQEASCSDFPAVAVGSLYQHLRIDCPDQRYILHPPVALECHWSGGWL